MASVVTAARQAKNPNTTPMVILLRKLSLCMKMGYTIRSSKRIARTAVRSEMVFVFHVKGTLNSRTSTILPVVLAQKEKDLRESISSVGMFILLTWGTNTVVSYIQTRRQMFIQYVAWLSGLRMPSEIVITTNINDTNHNDKAQQWQERSCTPPPERHHYSKFTSYCSDLSTN